MNISNITAFLFPTFLMFSVIGLSHHSVLSLFGDHAIYEESGGLGTYR